MKQEIEKECAFRNLSEQAWVSRKRNSSYGDRLLNNKKCLDIHIFLTLYSRNSKIM